MAEVLAPQSYYDTAPRPGRATTKNQKITTETRRHREKQNQGQKLNTEKRRGHGVIPRVSKSERKSIKICEKNGEIQD
jgi:hypothetical protein